MADYQIVIRDKSGNILGEFNNWKGLQYEERLNNYGVCSFSIPHTDPQLLSLVSLRNYETIIRRNGADVWGGEQAHRIVDLKANSPNRVTIQSFTFLEMLNSRFTGSFRRFDGVDQGTILKTIVDESQAQTNGDLGLDVTVVDSTVNRNREYSNQNIMEAWINMSNVIGGPDFEFNTDKTVNIYEKKGIDLSKNIIFEWGTNIENMVIEEDFIRPGNRAIVLGAGFGSSQLRVQVTNTKFAGVNRLREQRFSEIDISSTSVLTAKGESGVRKHQSAIMSLEFNQMPTTRPPFGSIKVGDSVRVRIKEGIYNINNVFRVYSYRVSVDDNNRETIRYLVGMI